MEASTAIGKMDGFRVYGQQLSRTRFSASIKGSMLLKMTVDPRRTENIKERTGNSELESYYQLRLDLQRSFEGAKRKNTAAYAQYIANLHHGQDGMTPAIILYTEQPLRDVVSTEEDKADVILIPWDVQLVAIDGETQLAARHEARNIEPKTQDELVSVIICHGLPITWAQQAFYDLNHLAIRPNSAVGVGMDQRDPLTHVARTLERSVPFFKGRVNTKRRQLRSRDREIVTITALRGACVTFAEGITGLKYGTRPVPVAPARIPAVRTAALEWFEGLARTIGPAIEDRENTVASAPSVLAALGALGHVLVGIDDPAIRAEERGRLLEQLATVNWTKGVHWEGIAGKPAANGFSIGGPKETAHTIYNALASPQSPGYARIREQAPPAAAVA